MSLKIYTKNIDDFIKVEKLTQKCISKAGSIMSLCKKTKFSRRTIYRILNGHKCTISTKIRLESFLNNNVD